MKTSKALYLFFDYTTFPNILLSILGIFFASINLSIESTRAIHSGAGEYNWNVRLFYVVSLSLLARSRDVSRRVASHALLA